MIPPLLSIALGTLVSEDAACIATGILVAQGQLGLIEGTFACFAGIFAGDLLLFLGGRYAPRGLVTRWIAPDHIARASIWIEKRGLLVVLLSRFTPGLRLPTYVTAGLLRSRFWAFAGYFLLASALWTPVLVAGTAAAGEQVLRTALGQTRPVFAMAAVAAALYSAGKLRDFETRRRLIGFFKRKVRWEFWPTWAAYLPLAPFFIYLAIRYRSLTLFTAANPGIPSGGLMGESKSAILEHLNTVPGTVPEFTVIRASLSPSERIAEGRRFMLSHRLFYPVVLKPDAGERGSGVAIVRGETALERALAEATHDTILQRYAPGEEFGVYYVRYPDQAHGRVLYVTRKRFPRVTGDGVSTLRRLILDDSRAVCLARAYFDSAVNSLECVPAAGAAIPLVEIGSHCRGTLFEDGSALITPALNTAIDRLSQAHPGFHIGRYDVRADSEAALSRGEFQVIELNGVSAEATQVYDPAVSMWTTYRVMARHWHTAFRIGAIHRQRGIAPMRIVELLRLLRTGSARAGWDR